MTQLYHNLEDSSARATELYTQTFRLLHADFSTSACRGYRALSQIYRASEADLQAFPIL